MTLNYVSLEVFTTQWILDLFSHMIPHDVYSLFLDNFFKYGWIFFYSLVLNIFEQIFPKVTVLTE